MSLDDEKLRSNIEFKEELIDDAKTDLEQGEVPDDRVHLVYNSLGGDYRALGVHFSLLGEESEAREQFTTAIDYYLSGVRTARERKDKITKGNRESEPSILLDALYSGSLSYDDDGLAEVARETLEMDAGYVTEFPETDFKYHAAKALASVVLDAEEAQPHLRSLEGSLDSLRPELKQFFGAIATVVEGILVPDSDTVAEGVQQLLDHHASTVQGEPTTTKEAVSLPATALLALARRKGIEVTIESEYLLPLDKTND